MEAVITLSKQEPKLKNLENSQVYSYCKTKKASSEENTKGVR